MISETLKDLSNYLNDAYAALQNKGAIIPENKTVHGLSAAIDTVQVVPGHFVEDENVYWDQDPKWEQLGQLGTKVIFKVGDEYAPELSVTVYCQNLTSTDPATINWGDGTTTTMARNTTLTRIYHTYTQPGEYEVLINDKLQRFGTTGSARPTYTSITNAVVINTATATRQIVHYGSKLTNLAAAFRECLYINSGYTDAKYIADYPPYPKNVTSISEAFYNCQFYTGQLPSIKRLSKCTAFSATYYNNVRATGHIQSFPPNTVNANQTYYSCQDLTGSIPYDVFPASVGTTMTACANCFISCYRMRGEYPKISHLTKVTSFAGLFQYLYEIGNGYDFPDLPTNTACTSTASMFYDNRSATSSKPYDLVNSLPNITTMQSMFYGCINITMPCPQIPSTCTNSNALYQTFNGCNKMTGTFPTIPSNYASSLYGTFTGCRNIKGQLPAIPGSVTSLNGTFNGCRGATGKLPSLGHIVYNGSDSTFCQNMFNDCQNISEPPDTFFDSAKCPNITSFLGMFSNCYTLDRFQFDLTGFTKVTTISSMFANCYMLKHVNMNQLPPNATTWEKLFVYCISLDENIPQWGSKVVNAASCYERTYRLKPMLNASGTIETDYTKIYKSTITSYSSLAHSSSWEVQKQFYNACVAAGKSGTLYGVSNITWI